MTITARLRLARLLLVPIVLASVGGLASQSTERSPADLVKLLTFNPADVRGLPFSTFSCGTLQEEETKDRTTADALIESGASALPAINMALDKLDSGELSPNLGTGALLYAFAQIGSVNSFPRLREMAENPRLATLQVAISRAIAQSLGLTSYVTSSTRPSLSICQTLGPRNVLDQFILAWEHHDRTALEQSLGPNAQTELRPILEREGWPSAAQNIVPAPKARLVSVGYRFEVFTDANAQRDALRDLTLETYFTNSAGEPCGQAQVQFIRNPDNIPAFGQMPFLIGDSNLQELFVRISKCSR